MSNIHGNPPVRTWTDPSTGVVYDAATMAPLPTAGEDLGEIAGPMTTRPEQAPTQEQVDEFAKALGIEPDAR